MKGKRVIDDWVDGEEMRTLAEKLLEPLPEPMMAEEELIFGSAFEGFADFGEEAGHGPGLIAETVGQDNGEASSQTKEPEMVVRRLPVQPDPFRKSRENKDQEQSSDHNPKEEVVKPVTVSPVVPSDPVGTGPERDPGTEVEECSEPGSESLVGFVSWLREQIPLKSCLIACGGNGPVFYNDMGAKRLKAVAVMLAVAYQARGGTAERSSSLVVRLTFGDVMQVIPLVGQSEFAALVLPRPLAEVGVRAFARALAEELAALSTPRHR